MAAAKLTLPLDPARTDAPWIDDITFYRETEAMPEDWTGYGARLAIVPRSLDLRATASFELTSEAAGGLEMLENGVGIRVDAAAMADRAPATYDFELRKMLDGEPVEAVLIGCVVIEQGLSEIVGGEIVMGPLSISGGQGGVRVIRSANGVRIVRGFGAQGERGPAGAYVGPTEPDLPSGVQALWIQTGLGPDGDQINLFLVTGD